MRIVRLIRLVKLWKFVEEALQKRKQKQGEEGDDRLGPGDDLDALLQPEDEEEEDAGTESESRVGKKLSELTTRKVIILILVMLFTRPFIAALDHTPQSKQYAVDMTSQAWHDYRAYYEVLKNTTNEAAGTIGVPAVLDEQANHLRKIYES